MKNNNNSIDIQTLYNEIKKLKLDVNKKEDDLKNLINEKDNTIRKLNEKILNQERRIDNNENEIKKLNEKIYELNKQNEEKFKEKENNINKINNTILNQEKELNKIIKLKEEENEANFGSLHNYKIIEELHKLENLEKNCGFLSSIQTKLLVPENDYEIEGFIKAPDNSPYKNGIFNFIIKYPNDYPNNSPLIEIKTKIYHSMFN